MKSRRFDRSHLQAVAMKQLLISLLAVAFMAALATTLPAQDDERSDRETRGDLMNQSFASDVSLSDSAIISMLRGDPALLLQSKRLLAEMAYNQGRWLAPEDLTDENLFTLIRSDSG